MKPFDAGELQQLAREQSGLSDFGPIDYLEGLQALVGSLNEQGELSESGRAHAQQRILRLLLNRLWFARDLTQHPEIVDEDIGSPVFIVSLPRTGSTKLHRMLGASNDFEVLHWWKAHMFARIPGQADGGRAVRIQETRDYEKWIYETSPGIVSGHPLFTDEPDEDQLLGEFSFRDAHLGAIFNAPAYTRWLMQADAQPAHDYFLMQLKYLQWQFKQGDKKPWLLKSPVHLGSEQGLAKMFSNPRFIFTHRDPVKCVQSITSTVRPWRYLYSDLDTVSALGPALLQLFAWKAAEHIKWRERNPGLKALDLGMREVTLDGPSAWRKVYDFLQMPLSAQAEAGMAKWEADNTIDKHGRNTYGAEIVAVPEDDIRATFTLYIERYKELM